MSRARVVLLLGGVLLVVALVVGCGVPVFLEPQPGSADYVSQRQAWDRTFGLLALTSVAVGLVALLLLAFGFVRWRAERWRTRHLGRLGQE